MWTVDHEDVCYEFLVNPELTKCIVTISEGEHLVIHTDFVETRSLDTFQYFVKLEPETELSRHNIGQYVAVGTVGLDEMEQLLRDMTSEYMPVFTHNEQWPESVRRDFTAGLHKFMASLVETTYLTQGRTILYVPDEPCADPARAVKDSDLVARLEATMVHWTRQVKDVVGNQEATLLTQDTDGPLEEIQFWRDRAHDLSNINKQLDRPGVQRIVAVLRLAESRYLSDYDSLRARVETGLSEANDNLRFLESLAEPCTQLSKAEPDQVASLLPRILNIVRMIWSASAHYGVEERLTGLLRKVSTQIVQQCSKALSLKDILDGDAETSLARLRHSIAACEEWRRLYARAAIAIARDPDCRNWFFDASANGIFAQVDAFVQRCGNLVEVCEGQLQFARISAHLRPGKRSGISAFGGMRARELHRSLVEIREAFRKRVHHLSHLSYDILNVKTTEWHYDYNHFKMAMSELELMMGNVINTAWENVGTVAAGVQLIEALLDLAVRPAIKVKIQEKGEALYLLFGEELKAIRSLFLAKQQKERHVPAGMDEPTFAGRALWAHSLLLRADAAHSALQTAHSLNLAKPATVHDAEVQYLKLAHSLTQYMRQMHTEWVATVAATVSMQDGRIFGDRLETALMVRVGSKTNAAIHAAIQEAQRTAEIAREAVAAARAASHGRTSSVSNSQTSAEEARRQQEAQSAVAAANEAARAVHEMQQKFAASGLTMGHLECNFDKPLLRLFTEVRAWAKLHSDFPAPYAALEATAQAEPLRAMREKVMALVRAHNAIIDALSVEEKRLFAEHLRQVDRIVTPGLSKITWTQKPHVKDWFLSNALAKCREVYALICQFKVFNAHINNNCARLADVTFISLEKKVVYDLVSFDARQSEHRKVLKEELTDIKTTIETTLRKAQTFIEGHPRTVQREWVRYVKQVDRKIEDALRVSVKRAFVEFGRAIVSEAALGYNSSSSSGAYVNPSTMVGTPASGSPLFQVSVVLDDRGALAEARAAAGERALSVGIRPSLSEFTGVINQTVYLAIQTIQDIQRYSDLLNTHALLAQEDGADGTVAALSAPSAAVGTTAVSVPVGAHTADVTLSLNAPQELSFFMAISNDAEILRLLTPIVNAPTDIAPKVHSLLKEFTDRYYSIWSPDKGQFIRRAMEKKREVKKIERDIEIYRNSAKDVAAEESIRSVGFLRADCAKLKQSILSHCQQWQMGYLQVLHDMAVKECKSMRELCALSIRRLKARPDTLDELAEAVGLVLTLQREFPFIESRFDTLRETYTALDRFDVHISDEEKEAMDSLKLEIQNMSESMNESEQVLEAKKVDMRNELEETMALFAQQVLDTRTDLKEHGPFDAPDNPVETDVEAATEILQQFNKRLADNRAKAVSMHKGMDVFGIPHPEYKEMAQTEAELQLLESVWLCTKQWLAKWRSWSVSKLADLNAADLDNQASAFQTRLTKMTRVVKLWKAWRAVAGLVQRFRQSLPLIGHLCSSAMRPRHWEMLQEETQQPMVSSAAELTLEKVFALGLHMHAEAVAHVASIAAREMTIETQLQEIARTWEVERLDLARYKGKYWKIRSIEQFSDKLEAHQLILATQKNSIFFPNFAKSITHWMHTLNELAESIDMMLQVQSKWSYHESVVAESVDIRKQLPQETSLFESVNASWVEVMDKLARRSLALDLLEDGLIERLTRMLETLEKINQKLDRFLETKRAAFPRFYFLANDDLLEVLGQGRDPAYVQKHLSKFFMGIKSLSVLQPPPALLQAGARFTEIMGVIAPDGEELKLSAPVQVDGEVEGWLREVERSVSEALQKELLRVLSFVQMQTHKRSQSLAQWIKFTAGQMVIASSQLGWTMKCQLALQDVVKNRKAIRRLHADWQEYITVLTRAVRQDLSKIDRLKINALTVIEVHNRDVIERLRLATKAKVPMQSFEWTSQLRFYFESKAGEFGRCFTKQNNATFPYGYEYQGNNGRLVVTPLTDRAYITMTNALSLILGCAPQGPAGTGKTETVKDLGKNLGRFVLIFNCTPNMDPRSLARIFSGLSQTGAWGCFDEFNRIAVDVLSVVALQVSTIFDALRQSKTRFRFDNQDMALDANVGIFITMNPRGAGYEGRSELPENLKALFRPIAMMVPDSLLIAEIMLLSEGFVEADSLAKKLLSVYRLVDQQLSKQSHYSYGLRALKAVLTRAGTLARQMAATAAATAHAQQMAQAHVQAQSLGINTAAGQALIAAAAASMPSVPPVREDDVLIQALRDMNTSSLVPDDEALFDGLLHDCFEEAGAAPTELDALGSEITNQVRLAQLQEHAPLVQKTLQLFESKSIRHGNMLVGGSLAGKSTAWNMLARSITALHAKKVALQQQQQQQQQLNSKNWQPAPSVTSVLGGPWLPVEVLPMNPKAVTVDELYGCYDGATKEWRDGALASLIRKACLTAQETNTEKWVVMDGPVDTLWIESMNSLLDDNKILTLVNQDRIQLPANVSLIFEVADLSQASPATVSRCGMIYMDKNLVGWRTYLTGWLRAKVADWEAFQRSDANAGTGAAAVAAAAAAADSGAAAGGDAAASNAAPAAGTTGAAASASNVAFKPAKGALLNREACDTIARLVDKFVVPILRAFDPVVTLTDANGQPAHVEEPVRTSDMHKVLNITRLFDVVATAANGVDARQDTGSSYLRMVELWWIFSTIWGLCGTLDAHSRALVDTVFRDLDTQFPPLQTCFDYVVDPVKRDWLAWEDRVPATWRPQAHATFHTLVVPTADTVKYGFLLNALVGSSMATLAIGPEGSGKTTIVSEMLARLGVPAKGAITNAAVNADGTASAPSASQDAGRDSNVLVMNVSFSYGTTSRQAQEAIESKLEKRQRTTYGPAGSKNALVVVIDDMNMPRKSQFGSQEPIEMLRQILEYGFVYERASMQTSPPQKHIIDFQILGTMAPPGGAREVLSERLMTKCVVLYIPFSEDAQIRRVYRTIAATHLLGFEESVKGLAPALANATLEVFKSVRDEFLPTPACPHYQFTLRDVAAVFQGVLRSDSKFTDTKEAMARLWVHECIHVFGDRLVSEKDHARLLEILNQRASEPQGFEMNIRKIFRESSAPVYSDLLADDAAIAALAATAANSMLEDADERAPYMDITTRSDELRSFLEARIAEFNRDPTKDKQDLVLFKDAVDHVLRIYRALTESRGHCLLVGVGGSGRQAMGRLGAYLAGLKVRQIHPSAKYDVRAFRDDLKELFLDCGVKRQPTALMMTDMQIKDEAFLEDITAIIKNGEVQRLFPPEELNPILDNLRSDAARAGVPATSADLYNFFISRARSNMHVIMCMSPVGKAFRERCRNFPALVNCCVIDWFSRWPEQALKEVANAFMGVFVPPAVAAPVQPVVPAKKIIAPLFAPLPSEEKKEEDAAKKPVKTEFTPIPTVAELIGTTPQAAARMADSLAQVFTHFHTSAETQAARMLAEMHRVNHITPTKYLDVVRVHKDLMRKKQSEVALQIQKLYASIGKLEATQSAVNTLGLELEEKNRAVAQKKNQCDKLMVEIMQKQRAADEQKRQVEIEAARTKEDALETMKIKMFAQAELDKVTPALEKAMKSLNELSRTAVTEVKSYTKPPKAVEKVMCAVMVILGEEVSWPSAKKQLSDPSFLARLQNFDKDNISNATLKAVGKYTKHKDFNADDISDVSAAAGALCDWVCAMEMYAKVFRDVQPRREALRAAELSLEQKTQQLAAAQAQLEEVAANLVRLEQRLQELKSESETVHQQAIDLEVKLARAAQLVDGLSDKRGRWDEQVKVLFATMSTLVGDCALAAGFLVYAGPFLDQYREHLIREDWEPQLKRLGVPYSATGVAITVFLASAAELVDWTIQGLPNDPLSLANGVLVNNAPRPPLMIDPQGQAGRWIRAKEESRGLVLCDLSNPTWLRTMETAMAQGAPVLVQDVPDDLDPLLDPVLSLFTPSGVTNDGAAAAGAGHSAQSALAAARAAAAANAATSRLVHFNDKDLDVRAGFRIMITSKAPNPSFSPEIAIKCTVVNFAVKLRGLEQQLLSLLVSLEEPKTESDRMRLIKDVAADRKRLRDLEDGILTMLGESEGTLLEDETLVGALAASKRAEVEVQAKLERSQAASAHIDAAREAYRPCAARAAMCYFVLADMAEIDPMYQFSLASYTELFRRSVADTRAARGDAIDVSERVEEIAEVHMLAMYQYASRALFDKHKLLFSFHLCLRKLEAEGIVDPSELSFLIRGTSAVVAGGSEGEVRSAQRPSNPCEWLSEDAWDLVVALDQLPSFRNLVQSVEQHGAEWRAWARAEDPPPDRVSPPADWQNRRGELQHILLLRVMRPDRLVAAIRTFIATYLDKAFIEPPRVDVNDIFRRSEATSPIVFILSPGVDPLPQLRALAAQQGVPLECLAMGRGQSAQAERAIRDSVTSGAWVYLANVHLVPDWLPELERLCATLMPHRTAGADDTGADGASSAAASGGAAMGGKRGRKMNSRFRLWMSSDPTPDFPIGLLQNSTKVTTEPPRGMRANMQRLYAGLTEEELNRPRRAERYKRILFSVAWMHATCVERHRFSSLGWNTPYDFAQSDFAVSQHVLESYLEDHDDIPWEAIRYLVGQANYGGRVTDAVDRRLLNVLSSQALNETVLQPRHALSAVSERYCIPEDGDLRDYLREINRMPGYDEELPEVLGQHANAQLAAQRNEAGELLSDLLALSSAEAGVGLTRDEVMTTLVQHLSEHLPAPVDLAHTVYAALANGAAFGQGVDTVSAMFGAAAAAATGGAPAGGSAASGPAAGGNAGGNNAGAGGRRSSTQYASLAAVDSGVLSREERPLSTVLVQEVGRYNRLIALLSDSLENLSRALEGRIVMSSALETVADALFAGRVPKAWSVAYPSVLPLASWMRDLGRRVAQLRKWSESGAPRIIWLGGLAFPNSYLSALQQVHARRTPGTSLDALCWEFTVMVHNEQALSSAPRDGALVKGLVLEGARWDNDGAALTEPAVLELWSEMPLVHFRPVDKRQQRQKAKAKGLYAAPLYLYSVRTGPDTRPSYLMDVELRSGVREPSFWSKRGTALLLAPPN